MKSTPKDRLKLAQRQLKTEGFYHGKIDGLWGSKSEAAYQQFAHVKEEYVEPPKDSYSQVTKTFGKIGDESNLVMIDFPYAMKYAGKLVKRTRCHRLIREPLMAVLKELLSNYGMSWIVEHGLDKYDGCYNYRKSRNSKRWSKHAWGVAIDFNASENANKTPWDPRKIGRAGYANMPIEAIEIFEKHGFKSGARAWGKDAMHFQYTQ